MKQEDKDEEFIDVSIGRVRLRMPDTLESIATAKRYIDSLYGISFQVVSGNEIHPRGEQIETLEPSVSSKEISIEVEPIETSELKEIEVEPTIKPLRRYKKLPVISEQTKILVEEEPIEIPNLSSIEEPQEVPSVESYVSCPLCNGKLKTKKVEHRGNEVSQIVFCKNKKCKFSREYVFSI
jgi:hypothetical protein